MYAGTSLTKLSGRVIGTHQKIDRTARSFLTKLLKQPEKFPTSRKILHFEGKKGPDALKYKSPSKDEPWHFMDPFDETDTQLQEQIEEHIRLLAKELKKGNQERSAFEAAWLAHAIVDGLAPAHHYPYEEKLEELRGGESHDTRTTIKSKVIMPGDTRRHQLKNNWLMWGPRGLLLGHTLFEFGVATILAPVSLRKGMPTAADLQLLEEIGFRAFFEQSAQKIARLDLYHKYTRLGWTPRLVFQVRTHLGPDVAKCVSLAWYKAAQEAGLA